MSISQEGHLRISWRETSCAWNSPQGGKEGISCKYLFHLAFSKVHLVGSCLTSAAFLFLHPWLGKQDPIQGIPLPLSSLRVKQEAEHPSGQLKWHSQDARRELAVLAVGKRQVAEHLSIERAIQGITNKEGPQKRVIILRS